MSDVAHFLEQQAREEEAATLGIYGMAVVSSHDAITARMQQGAELLLQLFDAGRSEEAFALWESGILEGKA